MRSRITVSLDDDVLENLRRVSRARGTTFRDTLNDLLRAALVNRDDNGRARTLTIEPERMGFRQVLNYDHAMSLLEYGEGELHR